MRGSVAENYWGRCRCTGGMLDGSFRLEICVGEWRWSTWENECETRQVAARHEGRIRKYDCCNEMDIIG